MKQDTLNRALILFIVMMFMAVRSVGTPRLLAASDSTLLLEGDLVFVLSHDFDNPITQATVHEIDALPIEHVGIVHMTDSAGMCIVEARPVYGVVVSRWVDFMERNKECVAGRLTDNEGVEKSVERALKYVGRGYDDLFMLDTNKIYCSELVQISFLDSSGNNIFDLVSMSFCDASGKILDYWSEYYHSRGLCVPQGALGTNPGMIARSKAVSLLER